MNSEKPKFLLCKLDPLEILREEEKKENYIEKLFSENLGFIFPDLIFLGNQIPLTHPESGKTCKLDSLAFNKRDKNFLIIEYKSVKSNDLLDQVIEYQECLEEIEDNHKSFAKLFRILINNRQKLVNILNEKSNSKKWQEGDFLWNQIKGMCIIAEMSQTLHYPGKRFKQYSETIRTVKITFYQEKTLHIDTKNIDEWLPNKNSQLPITKTNSPLLTEKLQSSLEFNSESISDITKIESISEKVKDWLVKIDNLLSSIENLDREINFKNLDYYPVVSYMVVKKILLSLVVKNRQINVYWNFKNPPEISQGLLNLLNKYQIEYSEKNHRGTGKWNFPIINNEDIFQELKEFIRDYKDYCGNDLKID